MLTAAVMQPLSGWIARRFGEVRTFVTSVCLFMLFSAICGLATSLPMLVAARLVQGLRFGPHDVGGAGDFAAQLSDRAARHGDRAVFHGDHRRPDLSGRSLGGWITDNLSWPWLFYINLPVGAFCAAASWMLLRHRESDKVKLPIDARGTDPAPRRRRQPAVHAGQRQ